MPPWQRGPAARSRQQQPPEAPAHAEPPRGAPSGLDARLNRFIAGGSAPAGAAEAEPAARGDRTEVVRTDSARPESGNRPEGGAGAYASELPDLSGPPPRPQPPRKPVERPATEQPVKAPAKAPASGRAVQVANRAHKGPVRASMQIRRIDPWSALKVSLVLSVALFFVWMIAVAFLYLVLGGMGVWSKLNSNVGDLLTSASGSAGGELVSSGTIFGGAALIGLVNIVLHDRDGNHRSVHLQPDHRPRRRCRGDPRRPGLTSQAGLLGWVWESAHPCGNLVARPRSRGCPNAVHGAIAQVVRALR